MQSQNIFKLSIIISCIVILGCMSFSFAQITNSTNYSIWADSFSSSGDTNQASTNYSGVMTIGGIMHGELNSSNFLMTAGISGNKKKNEIGVTPSSQYVDLGVLEKTAVSFGSHTLQAWSNSKTGYTLRVYGNTLDTLDSDDIDAIGASNQLSTPGIEQFGINLVANTSPNIGADPVTKRGVISAPYGTINRFAYVNGDEIATADKHSDDTYTISYIANIAEVTPAGYYDTTLTFAISSDF